MIAAAVDEALRERGLTQEAAASVIGLSQPALSRRMHGEVAWRSDDLDELADLLALPVEALVEPREVSA